MSTSPTSRPPRQPADTADQTHQGETVPVMSEGRAPRLPHERDESSSSQSSGPRKIMEQASKDLEAGLEDSSMGPPVDETYRREFRGHEGHAGSEHAPAAPGITAGDVRRRPTSSGKP